MDLSLPRGQGEFVVRIKGLPRSGWRTCGRTAGESRNPRFHQDFRGFRTCRLNPSGGIRVYTNELVDNILVSRDGFCDAGAKVYAAGRDLRDPLLSPVYGDMGGFPPTILTSGTRDLLLSNTVRVHRKLRQAGVEAVLQVFEGQSHAHYLRDDTAPETREVFEEIARFFDKHMGK